MLESLVLHLSRINCGPRGGPQGAEPGSGVQRFWGPLGASEFDPSFPQFGVSETPFQGPLEPWKASQKPRGGSSGASERGVRFQRSGKTRWATQRPLRGPVFPDAQPSGSYPRAADNRNLKAETGRVWFRRVRFQTANSVSFFALTEFWGAPSLFFVCQCRLTEFSAELTEFAAELSERSLPKQYSTRFL